MLLEMDNLHGHKCKEYVKCAREGRVEVAFSPEDCTDLCAVNDHHLGKLVKDDMKLSYKEDLAANREKWHDGTMTASERRIKFTFWLAEAWEKMKAKQETITAAFVACGILGAVNGDDDHLIQLGEEKGYKVELYDSDSETEDEEKDEKKEVKQKEVKDLKKTVKKVVAKPVAQERGGKEVAPKPQETGLDQKHMGTPKIMVSTKKISNVMKITQPAITQPVKEKLAKQGTNKTPSIKRKITKFPSLKSSAKPSSSSSTNT